MSARRVLTGAALGFGPLLSWVLLRSYLPAGTFDPGSADAALVLAWCPFLFFSVPSLVLQQSRDAALPNLNSPLGSVARAAILVPHEVLRGTRRAENVASLAGWALLVTVAGASAMDAFSRLVEPIIP